MTKKIYLLLFLLSLAFSLSSCDLFSTRQPENPINNNSIYQPATTIEIFKSNLENSFIKFDLNLYLTVLPDFQDSVEYNFIPSNDAQQEFANAYQNWTIQKEQRFFNNLISDLSKNEIQTFNIKLETQVDYPNYSLLSFSYTGTFSRTSKEQLYISGSSQLEMIKNQRGLWKIKKWIDFPIDNDGASYNFSRLKGYYSN